MSVRILRREQLVRRPRPEVFEFFSKPENLARLTPAALGFELLTPSPIRMREGGLVDYRIHILGIPLRWRTMITAYDAPRLFVDEQLTGPYSFWHHTHSFEETPDGTLVRDEVRYLLPMGAVGDVLAGAWVASDLDGIFRYRRKALAALFPDPISDEKRNHTMNIVIAGGTGFIGAALVDALIARGDKTTLLVRDEAPARARWGGKAAYAVWDGRSPGPWTKTLDDADAVINFSGASIAGGRWTPARKLELINSRIRSTRALVAAISQAAKRPSVLLNASAVGYYGDVPEGTVTETSSQGRDFLASLCGQWEREALAAEPLGVRVVLARFGVVLEDGGGALAKMALPFKLFGGGPLGSGKQAFPWVHRDDAVGAALFALDHDALSGAMNVVGPTPVDNRAFSAALGRALHRPSWAPAPAFAIRLALGEMADMLLTGQSAAPKKLLDAGYKFKYATPDEALTAVYQ